MNHYAQKVKRSSTISAQPRTEAYSAGVEARELLKALREAQGITQEQLAYRVGKTLGSVSGWETGLYRPRRAAIAQVDEALEAGGKLVAAFYPSTNPLDVLREDHEALVLEVADLRETVQRLLELQAQPAKRRTARG